MNPIREAKRKTVKKSKDGLRDWWHTINAQYILYGGPRKEAEDKESGAERLFNTNSNNNNNQTLPNLGKEIDTCLGNPKAMK